MEFSNLLFLYILLPSLVLVYFLMHDIRKKNLALLIFSLAFYGMCQPVHMGLMILLSYLNFRLALRIDRDDRSTVILPVAVNIVVLAVFMYLDCFLGSFDLGFLSRASFFPLGLSFYTFSVISYLADVYDDRIDPEEDFLNLLLYLMMFPKLPQGPVVRYENVAEQLVQRKHHPRTVFLGFQRFVFGLAKKVLLADYCGRLLEDVNASGGDTTLVGVWFAAILFMFRIYYEFSGYSDMAIGLGRIFGFRYCENFQRPYLALSVSEFTNRWHMSMGSFFRDYVYIPLGGNRMGKSRQVSNLFVVWLLVGLWHGLSWNYVLWGVYFFAILVIEKHFIATLENLPDWLCRCVTLWLVLVGWIIFSHESFPELQAAVIATLGFGGFAVEGLGRQILNSIPLLFACALGCTQFPVYVKRIFDRFCGMAGRQGKTNHMTLLRVAHLFVSLAVICLLLWLCTISLANSPSLPSIYGNF